MDAGEFGFGLLASPLAPGLDVPENAVLLDGLVAAAIPDPSVPVVPLPLSRVMGVFERLTGSPAWRHFEQFSNGAYEGRAEVELVVRSIAQVGNYDYLIDWIFTQSGGMRVEVGLTGIDAPKAVGAQLRARRPAHEHAGRARAGGAFPQPSLQLPARPRHRRPGQLVRPRQAARAAGAGTATQHLDAQRGDAGERERGPARRRQHAVEGRQSESPQLARRAGRLRPRVARQRRAAARQGRLPRRRLHRPQPLGHRPRSRRALRRRRHAEPEPGRAGAAAVRARQPEPRQSRHRSLADGRLSPRHAGRGLAGALARASLVRAQAGELLRPQPGRRPAPGAVRGARSRAEASVGSGADRSGRAGRRPAG